MTWRVKGSYFEACNCDAICPCRSVGGRDGSRSTYGVCQFVLSWHIDDGHFDDVRLDGLEAVMAGFYDDDEPRSPWRISLYIDERATDEQFGALADIFLGRAGGTARSNYAAAIAEVNGVHRAHLDLGHEHGAWRIGVEGRITVQASQLFPSEETVACGIPGLDHPGQELVASRMMVQDAPLSWDVNGRCAFATDFDYAST